MIHAIYTRAFQDSRVTLGVWKFPEMEVPPLYCLENPKRETDKDSCIDAGEYLCKPFSGKIFKNVWELQNVPRRSAILIHAGNSEADTLGCLLVGLRANGRSVEQSQLALDFLRKMIGQHNEFRLTILDPLNKV